MEGRDDVRLQKSIFSYTPRGKHESGVPKTW
jgi:hypothetical protein